MPVRRRLAQPLLASCLVLVTWLGAAPGPAAALEPPRPLPDHRPVFVTETDVRPWRDCLWASASMLLDKWTNGDVRVSHQRLRRLSGDLAGGSSFEDLAVAFRRLGLDVALDANGDSTLTWAGLLARLRRGAGAVVLGDYSSLPRWFGRWDYRFWRGRSKTDDHAVYVERYDARRGRVWIMDPLGRDGYRGEWISTWALYRYAWFKGDRVQAVTTPTARPAPFAGVTLDAPEVTVSRTAVTATWPLHAGRAWRFQGADVRVTATPVDDALMAAARSVAAGTRATHAAAPARPVAQVTGGSLRADAALPTRPGAYLVTVGVTDRRFGRQVGLTDPVAAFVAGARRATIRVHADERTARAKTATTVWITVSNVGQTTWTDADRLDLDGRDTGARSTRLVATWIRLDEPAAPVDPTAAPDSAAPVPSDAGAARPAIGERRRSIDLPAVPLLPGDTLRLSSSIVVPATPGRWALVIDVVDDVDGSFAAHGSAPAVGLFDIVAEDAAASATADAE